MDIKFDLTKILIEYKTVVGTLAGSALTIILTHILREKGKINLFVNECKESYREKALDGSLIMTDDISKAKSYEFFIDVDICNNSSSIKYLRDVHIEFVSKRIGKRFFVRNHATLMDILNGKDNSEAKIIYLSPKEISNFKLSRYIGKENLLYLKNADSVYLVGKSLKNKTYRWFITNLNRGN